MTAIKAINFAVDQGIIRDERKYSSENLEDMKIIWYKLKDDVNFNIKCSALTLIYKSFSTLTYKSGFTGYTLEQIAMAFSKYNPLSDMPNNYGKDCADWYQVIHKYNH
ncbi:hypothetical protein [Scatolibacter rhodanostii]|uniref:hypothetical protein n=1 Tax=Scatolibacter rhodanostii TaxID=2014781 RepID=UPI000C084779|nr:hypothetical protein [Scatolibacter rhodanostii]